MLGYNGKRISRIMINGKVVSALWLGAKKIYEAVRSCFGAGFWRGDKPWVGSDAWKGR